MKRVGDRDSRPWRSAGHPRLAEMERRGSIRRAKGNLLGLTPIHMPNGKRLPSDLAREGRGR